MVVTTRFQFEQGNQPPFTYTQLPSRTRHLQALASDSSSSSDTSDHTKSTPWYNNQFSAFKTPKSTDSVSLMVIEKEKFQCLQEHFDRRDNQAHLDREHSKDIMDNTRHLASRDLTHEQLEFTMFDPRAFVSGTRGNNTPLRSPRPSSPQR